MRRSFSIDEPKTFEKQPPTMVWRVQWWKRWYTVLVGWDHRRDLREDNGRWRRRKNWARLHWTSGSNDGGRRLGHDPLCVKGEEGVAGEKGVASSRRKFF